MKIPSAADIERARRVSLSPADGAAVKTAMVALPAPEELAPGTLVIVAESAHEPQSLARSVLRAFGRTKTIPRAIRCSALVARGYVQVGAGADPTTREDLAWGRRPSDEPTEPSSDR